MGLITKVHNFNFPQTWGLRIQYCLQETVHYNEAVPVLEYHIIRLEVKFLLPGRDCAFPSNWKF